MKIARGTFVVGLLAAPARIAFAADEPPLRFGVPPWQKDQTLDDIRGRYKPLCDYLSRGIGRRIEIVGARDYKESATQLASGQIDLATISPEPFVEAQRANPGVKMLATELSINKETGQKTDSYRGYILVLKSRGDLKSLADLKGKRFAFVTKESTSGYVIPNSLMRQEGINYETYFEKAYFLGSHPRVTDAIAAGSVDAGATWDFNWNEATRKHGDIFRAIVTSPPIPNLGIAAHPSLAAATQEKIRNLLVKVDPALLDGVSAKGYVVKPDSFYDVIRRIDTAK